MQLTEQIAPRITERKRAEAVVETLATMRNPGETLAELAHDAKNMVTALALYCDLLEEPGVLGGSYLHYGSELRLVAAASRRLVEKLALLDSRESRGPSGRLMNRPNPRMGPVIDVAALRAPLPEPAPNPMIDNLQEELLANCNLLDAMAGLSVLVTVETRGGALPVNLAAEDLTRMLVNLVKNAAESMHSAGTIRILLSERAGQPGITPVLLLTVEDTGPGIPENLLEQVFEPGFTTRHNRAASTPEGDGGWPMGHRGLGLSITRSIVDAAGGRIHAENCAICGARFRIELPVRNR